MYAVPTSRRVYLPLFLCLCAAFFSSSTLAKVNPILQPSVQTAIYQGGLTVDQFVRSGVATVSQDAIKAHKRANVKTGLSSGSVQVFQSINNSAARRVAGSVLRGGFYGGLAIEGVSAVVSGYQNFIVDYNEGLLQLKPLDAVPYTGSGSVASNCPTDYVQADNLSQATLLLQIECSQHGQVIQYQAIATNPAGWYMTHTSKYCPYTQGSRQLESTSMNSNGQYVCNYGTSGITYDYIPASEQQVQVFENKYNPAQSDFDALDIYLASGQKDGAPFDLSGVEFSEPSVIDQPSTTTETVQSGNTTTVKTTVPTLSMSLLPNGIFDLSLSESVTTDVYEGSNLESSNTVITTKDTSQKAIWPQSNTGTGSAPIDFELPSFCSWASIVCDWIGWTKEPLDELEPDLTVLISDFEPDEEGYDLGIGSGSCPAPMMLNLGIINKTVEVKYDPFCDFLEMIRPFVLAAAYLFAAYMYLGVLRRG